MEKNQAKECSVISVIIPVYNAEATIERCVRSLMEQSYPYMEILLVDDGSTDKSAEICRALAETDARIHIHTQSNRGVSAARNAGLREAKGDYIAFTDADDYWEPNSMESLLSTLLAFDAAVCGSYEMAKLCEEAEPSYCALPHYDFTQPDAQLVIWGALYKRDLLNDMQFDETIHLGEDTLFISQAIYKAGGLAHTHKKLYHYEIYTESASHGEFTVKKYTEMTAWRQIVALFANYPTVQSTARATYAEICGRRYREYSHAPSFTREMRDDIITEYRKNLRFLLAQPIGFAKKCKFAFFGVFPRVYIALLNRKNP